MVAPLRRPSRRRLRRPLLRRPRLLRRPLAYWAVAGLVAAAAGWFVADATGRAQRAASRYGEVGPVAVAVRDIPAGHEIRDADVELRDMPRALVPDDAVDEPPLGSIARTEIAAGEVVVARRLAPEGLSGPSALIPDGHRGVSVPTGPGRLPLSVGDVVDVLATVDPLVSEEEVETTSVVAAGALVVGVDDEAATVAVAARDAPALAAALAVGTVTLTLAGAP